MSYIDVSLPGELRNALSVLQTHAQPMPVEKARAILRRELGGRAEPLLANLEATPTAAASIGQVHRARLAGGEDVAMKVQYPEVESAIESDFIAEARAARTARGQGACRSRLATDEALRNDNQSPLLVSAGERRSERVVHT